MFLEIIYNKLLQYQETLRSHEVNMKHCNETVESYNADSHPKEQGELGRVLKIIG
jgi:hypothetical protein